MRTKLCLYLILLMPVAILAQDLKDERAFDPTYTHVVYFWLKNPENVQDRKVFDVALRNLFKDSRYTQTNFLGAPPKATREVVDDSFTFAMIVTFESAEAQKAYQTEAAHLKFIEQTKHLLERFVVYDAQGLKP
ncbi:Dabb family protein [Robiginitalea aurantiaca]|uniref:Dabb family protein n=1 Tax=Robiginitalea aurantiaca TaxID=3056915 RepID=A0ABT7WBR8_9FLAO|nr:Dabb family protein [Robiginitalea aurantiaca]MDM9630352.1 Dabb family protein [Robiginitalea aurantiaca]